MKRLLATLRGIGLVLAGIAAGILGAWGYRRWRATVGQVDTVGAPFGIKPGVPSSIMVETPDRGWVDVALPPDVAAADVDLVEIVAPREVVVQVKHSPRDRRGQIGGGP